MLPSFLADRTAAALVAMAAMSTLLLFRAAWTSALSVTTSTEDIPSLSAIILAAPTPVGPDRTISLGPLAALESPGSEVEPAGWPELEAPEESGWLELAPGAEEVEPLAAGLGPQPASRVRESAAVRRRERVRFMVDLPFG